MHNFNTLDSLLIFGKKYLQSHNIENYTQESLWLLLHAIDQNSSWFLAHKTTKPSSSDINYYLEFEFDALIGAAIINYDIPFGVLKDNQGKLVSIDEKPNFSFRVASGIYLFKSSLFNSLKNNTYIDMPKFIEKLIIKKYNVGVFPIHEKWIDIGTPKSLFEAKKFFSR